MIGHAVVISSTVQMHILLFPGDEDDAAAARQRLERNFVILSNLQRLWRTVDYSLDRLKEFHEACLRAKEAQFEGAGDTFRLDKWMLSFLMEFSKPIQQRAEVSEFQYDDDQQLTVHDDYTEMQNDLYRWSMDELGINIDPEQGQLPLFNPEEWQNPLLEQW